MKYFFLVALSIATAIVADIRVYERENGDNGWYIPHINGSWQWMDMDAGKFYLDSLKVVDYLLPNPVNYYLFTKSNSLIGQEIFPNIASIKLSKFNAANPTTITIHGWTSTKNDPLNTGVCEALFSKGDANVIVIDWARARSIEYASSVVAIPEVGKQIAGLINLLVSQKNLNLDTLHIVGHSLGAHVAGFTSKYIESGKAGAVVGLDPALPFFCYNLPATRLNSTDAKYVEIYHTCGGKLGFLKNIGITDFYFNGGQKQNACNSDLLGSCSHSMAVTYYIEYHKRNAFDAFECHNYKQAVARECGFNSSSIRVGDITNADIGETVLYVPTNDIAPYGTL